MAIVLIPGVLLSWLIVRGMRRPNTRVWPRPVIWLWNGCIGLLAAVGLFLVSGLALTELREKRVGLGLGVVTSVILATIKGVSMAAGRYRAGGE